MTESCETSLRQLGLDSVDLMQLHLYWPTWGHDGYWMDELQALKQAGKARSVGISIPDHRHDSAISLVESGLIDSVQTILNIFGSEPLDTLIPICQAQRRRRHRAVHPRRGRAHRHPHRGREVRARRLPARLLRLDRSAARLHGQGRRAAPVRSRARLLPGRSRGEVRHPPSRRHHGHHLDARRGVRTDEHRRRRRGPAPGGPLLAAADVAPVRGQPQQPRRLAGGGGRGGRRDRRRRSR